MRVSSQLCLRPSQRQLAMEPGESILPRKLADAAREGSPFGPKSLLLNICGHSAGWREFPDPFFPSARGPPRRRCPRALGSLPGREDPVPRGRNSGWRGAGMAHGRSGESGGPAGGREEAEQQGGLRKVPLLPRATPSGRTSGKKAGGLRAGAAPRPPQGWLCGPFLGPLSV